VHAGDCVQLSRAEGYTTSVGLTPPDASGKSTFSWHTWQYTTHTYFTDTWHGKWVFSTASGTTVATVTQDGPGLINSSIKSGSSSTQVSVNPALYGQIASVQWYGSC
jgi:hypothetical protein